MRNYKYYLFLSFFVIYWTCTLIFVSPKNFITISLFEQEQYFNMFFFQKWSFFAPPPRHNDRLYFKFESKKDSTEFFVYEVIQPLQKRKSIKAPFNSSEDILDYIISSTILSISDGLIAINESFEYEKDVNGNKKNNVTVNSQMYESKQNYIENTSSFKTLKNYGVFVANKNNVKCINEYYLTISIVQIEMPKFVDRHLIDCNVDNKQRLIYESTKISL